MLHKNYFYSTNLKKARFFSLFLSVSQLLIRCSKETISLVAKAVLMGQQNRFQRDKIYYKKAAFFPNET